MNRETGDIIMQFCLVAAIVATMVLMAVFCGGCQSTYKGGKAVDGTDLEVAIKPYSDSTFQFQFFHYLNGFVFYWEANDSVTIKRKSTSKWSCFGVVGGENVSESDIQVDPCETAAKPE